MVTRRPAPFPHDEVDERLAHLYADELTAAEMNATIRRLMVTSGAHADRALAVFVQHLPEDEVTSWLATMLFAGKPNAKHYSESWHSLRAHALGQGWLHHDVAFYDHETGVHIQSIPRDDYPIQREHRRALLLFRLIVDRRRGGL